ncbi:hypothetical protein [Bacteroides graminisolvens]|uniref:hypothetical protein n=1 Tax=Bacteroides graminisolvens TaxID=477666 RepID=UPI00046A1EE0|nr:hypothetical protein [Bacteroides graminisolvens]
MSQEVRTPLQVTAVTSVADTDYIDLTLANGTKARVLKSQLYPVNSKVAYGMVSPGTKCSVIHPGVVKAISLGSISSVSSYLIAVYHYSIFGLYFVSTIQSSNAFIIKRISISSGVESFVFYKKDGFLYVKPNNSSPLYVTVHKETGTNESTVLCESTADDITDATVVPIG